MSYMKWLDWHKHKERTDRPVKWCYWPVSIGWVRNSCHAFICWHGWPMDGCKWYPDATAVEHGWTVHVGALKIRFGKRNSKEATGDE